MDNQSKLTEIRITCPIAIDTTRRLARINIPKNLIKRE